MRSATYTTHMTNTTQTPNRTKLAMYDAVDATLRLLMERRTRGRMALYLAVKAMLDAAAEVAR